MEELRIEVKNGNNIQVSAIDEENEIEIYFERDDSFSWITKEQAKQLIEFLQKQIKA